MHGVQALNALQQLRQMTMMSGRNYFFNAPNRSNRDLVKGLKAHAEIGGFARWGVDVMRLATRMGREAELPVYIHFGQLWPKPEEGGLAVDPDSIFNQVVEMLKPGDVLVLMARSGQRAHRA